MNLNLLKLLCAKSSQPQGSSATLEKRETFKEKSSQLLKSVALSLLFIAISGASFAQNQSVSGTVVDTDGYGIPGVTVMVVGTTSGTTTDMDGNYTISVAPSASLEFSYIGYETITMEVGVRTKIDVVMDSSSENIDEVVVVGYGVQKKETLTGSIVQVKADEALAGKSTASAMGSLQGEVPGLTYTRTSSRPGNEDESVYIRGDMSVNNITPLILLDGIEVTMSQLSSINSNEIESFSVLKDGSAAIFGTKAAGGVILVTTKKGQAGAIKVDFNAELQLNIPNSMPLANAYEYAQMVVEGYENTSAITYVDSDGVTQSVAGSFPGQTFQNGIDDYYTLASGQLPANQFSSSQGQTIVYDAPDLMDYYYGVTTTQRYSISVSGGSEKLTARTSIGYSDERSSLKVTYDGQKKYNFRSNMTYKPNDVITVDFGASYDVTNLDVPTKGVGMGIQDPWVWPIFNENGQIYSAYLNGANSALAQMLEGGRTTTQNSLTNISGKLTADLSKITEGLSISYQGNASYRLIDKMTRLKQATAYDWEGEEYSVSIAESATAVTYNITTALFQNHLIQGNWMRSFGKNNVAAMVGMTSELYENTAYQLKRTNMSSADLDDINLGDSSTSTNSGASSAYGLVSYMARLNYDYNNIVMAEASFRRDGSSKLSADNRWADFMYASAGIRLTELDSFKGGFFDNLKVYASYGETGSTTGIGNYDYFSTISTGTRYFGLEDNVAVENTSWIGSMTTDDRTWERVAKSNIGVDFAILDSRLSGTMEYYYNRNNDMLVSVTYPSIIGGTAPKTNSGDFVAQGWEVSLNWRDRIGDDFRYNVGVAVWDSRSLVTKMEGQNVISAGLNDIVEGQPLGAIYMYKASIMQNESEVLQYYKDNYFSDPDDHNSSKSSANLMPAYNTSNRLVPGCVAREDLSGDGIITTDDLYMMGDDRAHYSFSFNLGFQWKNFDFSAFFQGVGQQNIIRTNAMAYPFSKNWMNQNTSFIGTCWSETNTDAEFPILLASGDSTRRTWNWTSNDINVVDAWYLRAKTISVGYTVPRAIVEKAGLENARISVSGNDLFCLSNVSDGLDPEYAVSATQGSIVPFNSTVLFNLQLTF